MTKRLLRGAFSVALSVTMMMGTVMVGATENSVVSEKLPVKVQTVQDLNVSGVKKATTTKSKNVKTRTIKTSQLITATYVVNKTQWDNATTYGYISGTSTSDELCQIKVNANGMVLLYGPKTTTSVTAYLVNVSTGKYYYGSYGAYGYYFRSVPAGTYSLRMSGEIAPVQILNFTNGNVGLASTARVFVGNGGNQYQYFNISRRSKVGAGAVATVLYSGYQSGVSQYIQKRNSNGSYSTITDTIYTNSNGAFLGYALSAGKYRMVYKNTLDTYFYSIADSVKSYTGSYATRKSKAKTVSRKKYKDNVLTATDKKGTTHWYKIKVTKRRSTRIDVSVYNSSGKVYVALYKGSKRLSYRNCTYPYGSKMTGTLSKGTYYIRVTKTTAKTSGQYRVKYTK